LEKKKWEHAPARTHKRKTRPEEALAEKKKSPFPQHRRRAVDRSRERPSIKGGRPPEVVPPIRSVPKDLFPSPYANTTPPTEG